MSEIKSEIEKIYKRLTKIAQKGKEGTIDYYDYINQLIGRGQYDAFCQCLFYYYYIDVSIYADVDELKKKTYSDVCFATKSSFLERLSSLYKKKRVSQSSTKIYSYDPILTECQQTGPLSTTYSLTGLTASITFGLTGEQIGVSITNPDVYRISISKARWNQVGTLEIPENIEPLQSIQVDSATYSVTQIPTSFASSYLIETFERNPYSQLNYKLQVNKINLLGSIKEIDLTTQNPAYYVLQKPVARFYGDFNTYLEVTKVGSTSSVIIDYFDPKISDDSNLIKRYQLALDYLMS